MKKSLVVILAALMLLTGILAACDEAENDESSVPATSAEPSAEPSVEPSTEPSVEPSESGAASDAESIAESSSAESSMPESNAPENSVPESSVPESSAPAESEPEESNPPVASSLSVYACRYTAKPHFVILGKCDDGAVISGTANGKTVQTKSHGGLFALRLSTDAAGTEVILKQTVGGKQVGTALNYTANPVSPDKSMWGVIVGDNYQMFLEKSSYDYIGMTVPGDKKIQYLKDTVSHRADQLAHYNNGAEIIYMIVPSPMTVYPELVPDSYKKASQTGLEKVNAALKEAGATVIDLASVFKQHKNDQMPLYFKTDSHWSDYGAYIAYTELFNHISKRFPDAAPRKVSEFDWNLGYYQGGDMTYYLAQSDAEGEQFKNDLREYTCYRTMKFDVPMIIKNTPRYVSSDNLKYNDAMTYKKLIHTYEPGLPKCAVLRDSFSTQIYDILAERTNMTCYYGMWDYTWNITNFKSLKVDYVIYIISEWNIDACIFS